jgi:hypothetical protein
MSRQEVSTTSACFWCGACFEPRNDGGKAQRFCRPTCRRAFETASRRFVAEAIAAGTLTIDMLRNSAASTRALVMHQFSPSPVPSLPKPEEARPAPPEEFAKIVEYDGILWLLDGHTLIQLTTERADDRYSQS